MDRYLFFSAEAESPVGYYLMEMWNPVEMAFNAIHVASEYRKQMEGIYTTSVNRQTIDECPMAYKSIDDITGNISETVEIIDTIKPIYNFKAGDE